MTAVELSPRAAAAVRRRGGELWIWEVAGGGFAATSPPHAHAAPGVHAWETVEISGVRVHVEREIAASRWRVDRARVPWPRFVVTG